MLRRVCIVPRVAGSGEWQKRYYNDSRSAHSTGPPSQRVTGYIAIFTLALYVARLILLAFVVNGETAVVTDPVLDNHQQLSAAGPSAVREARSTHYRDT